MSRKLSSPLLVSTFIFLSATSGFAQATGHTRLRDNHPALANRWSFTHPANPQLPLTLRITLALRNKAALDQLVHDQQDPASPRYHQWLTAEQFGASFGPSADAVAEVSSWLSAQGFRVIASSLPMRSITFTGTAAAAQQAFQTPIATARWRRSVRQHH